MPESAATIRFGVLYKQPQVASWEEEAVRAILALAGTSLQLLIHLEAPAPAATTDSSASYVLWRSYLQWGYSPAALRPVGGPGPRWQVPVLACTSHPTAAVMAAIKAHRLDFILSFGGGPGSELLPAVARLGVWGFEFGKLPALAPQPVGIWETARQELLTTAALRQFGGAGPGGLLRQGFFRTHWHSPSHTADSIYEECANWPADLCRQLLASGKIAHQPPATEPATPAATPPLANLAMVAFLARLAKHKLRNLYHTFLVADQWNIGVVSRPVQDFLCPDSLRNEVVDAPPLPNRNVFYADCFARQEAAETVVYFERYDYRVRRGTIERLTYPWQPDRAPVPVLRFPYHLSYPFLHGPYCLPEAWVTNTIRLYDLREPVTDPAVGHVLLPVPGVDTTLLEYEGRYWLFYTRTDRDPMLNLFIAYADALHGPWHEHPQNPVKTDIRSARPGGPFFEAAGKLYRPAQDCARDYGYAIAIQEVLTLTTTEYAEREVANLPSLHPGYPDGMHTLAALSATQTLIDFKRRRFIPMATVIACWGVVARILYSKRGRRKPLAVPVVVAE